jgi:hypothetical protein
MKKNILSVTMLCLVATLSWSCSTNDEPNRYSSSGRSSTDGGVGETHRVDTIIVNDTCPCMRGKANTVYTTSYNGSKVGFCCDSCANQWNGMSESNKAEKYSSITTKPMTWGCPVCTDVKHAARGNCPHCSAQLVPIR